MQRHNAGRKMLRLFLTAFVIAVALFSAASAQADQVNLREMSTDEFVDHFLSKPSRLARPEGGNLLGKKKTWKPPAGQVVPKSVDWREKGVVGPVRTQHKPHEPGCGACWAFAAVAVMESANAIATGSLVPLSEQQLIDCDVKGHGGHDYGCDGGWSYKGIDYTIKNGGLASEEAYPFISHDGVCNETLEREPAGTVDWWKWVVSSDEEEMKAAVAEAPVLASICVGSAVPGGNITLAAWKNYTSGVMDFHCCNGYLSSEDVYDHSIMVAGYGEEDGTPYWLIKNSWGEEWGEQGFGKVVRGKGSKHGFCGIAFMPLITGRNPPAEDGPATQLTEAAVLKAAALGRKSLPVQVE